MKFAEFEALKNYDSPTVYFCEHDMKHSCLIAIPSFNWSFLVDYKINFKDERPMLIKALSKCVSDYDAESIADVLYDFVFSELN
ncbi:MULTISPECIES: YueH family protein [Bacillus]|uniref:YueH family protein n=1 Tax=Bacillus TaxID=1386 RepID=UPI0018F2B179|nr:MULTISPECIES: YueH family protein [Bacillus cereus group]MBJ8024758.1 hypothetical protein [Bacillus cereus]MBJ8037209.1 hypothetical protein [Bacillus cereus]